MPETASREARRARCLTAEEIAAVQAAAPGEAPEALARHLATCPLCQERALFGPARRQRRGGRTAAVPSLRRALLLLALVLTALVGLLYTLSSVAGRIR